jgi:phosphoribosylformylglycinamidine synthase subunit PurS
VRFEVTIELKKEVLDAEGRTILDALKRAGAEQLKNVTVSKRYVIDVADAAIPSPIRYAEKVAADYLANPVSETFSVRQIQ